MFGIENFALDRFSFWLGFAAGGLFFLLINRLSKFWHPVRETVRKFIRNAREKQLAGVDPALRQDVLRRAQRNHLAARMFSLDEILIPPSLLAPPPFIDPTDPYHSESLCTQVITVMPECPEFAANYAPVKLDLLQALQNHANIAIVARAGAGKSTALANLATRLARKETLSQPLSELFPIYLHILDIEFDSGSSEDPLDSISRAVSKTAPITVLNRVPKFIRTVAEIKGLVLLLDGMDELPPRQLADACKWVEKLFSQVPSIRVITTASVDYINGLTRIGFEALALAGWTREQVSTFISRWGTLWKTHITDNQNPETGPYFLNEQLVNGWLDQEQHVLTPFEWTLKLWGVYAGDLEGPDAISALDAYLNRCAGGPIFENALSNLAQELLQLKKAALELSTAEKLLAASASSHSPGENRSGQPAQSTQNTDQLPDNKRKPKPISSAIQTLDRLIEVGLLVERGDQRVSFTSPVWAGYFAARPPETLLEIQPQSSLWSYEAEYFHYDLAQRIPVWLEDYLQSDSSPLYRNLINTALWMRDIPTSHPNRSRIMRQVAAQLQNEGLPYGTRLRLLAAVSLSNDPALAVFFRQLVSSQSSTVRALAALGSGAIQDGRAVQSLESLLSDESEFVQKAACLAITAIDDPGAKAIMANTLLYGSENLRLIIAEMLADRPSWGHELLQECIDSEDLLVRRSAVFGISKIEAAWVIPLLEKVAVEDSQWVVRNSAGQALDSFQRPDPYIPRPPLIPAETPWLITFAAAQGQGVSKEGSPVPLLRLALQVGSHEEKLAALELLRHYHDQTVLTELFDLINQSHQPDLLSSAHYTLWIMAVTGSLSAESKKQPAF